MELIEKIFIYAENLRLALTNTLLDPFLSQDIPRLRLCVVIFGQDFTHNLYYPQHSLTRVSERDTNLMKLQQLLVDQSWFTASFTRRLEALVPPLQARERQGEKEDKTHMQQASDPGIWPRYHHTPRSFAIEIVRMPKSLLTVNRTDGKVEMFHRLRSWYIEPDIRADGELHLCSILQQAVTDGRDEVVAVLD